MTKKAQKGGKGRGDHRPTRGGGGGGQRGNLSATDHELLTELRDQREQAQKRKDRILLLACVPRVLLQQMQHSFFSESLVLVGGLFGSSCLPMRAATNALETVSAICFC